MRKLAPALCLLIFLGMLAANVARASEPLAIIAALGTARRPLTLDEVQLIYLKKKLYWEDGSRIAPINLPASNPTRREFSLTVLERPLESLESYWNDMYFHGVTPPFVVGSNEAAIRFIEQTPNGIAYLPLCSVDRRVAILLIVDGIGQTRPGTESGCVK